MTIPTDCYCQSLPEYDTTLTMGVHDHYRRLLLLVTARVQYHSYSESLCPLQMIVTAGYCQGRIPLLQWESMTITVTAGYCEGTIPLLPRESMTITTDCYDSYSESL